MPATQGIIAQRFRDAVRSFVRAGGAEAILSTSGARARVFIEEAEPELSRAFLLDYTERAMRAEEREAARAAEELQPEPPQMKFLAPGFADLFRSPHQRLPVGSGRKAQRVPLERMTIGQIRRAAAVYARRARRRAESAAALDERRAQYLGRIAEEMSPWVRTHYRLTYGDYLQLRLDGIGAPRGEKAGVQ